MEGSAVTVTRLPPASDPPAQIQPWKAYCMSPDPDSWKGAAKSVCLLPAGQFAPVVWVKNWPSTLNCKPPGVVDIWVTEPDVWAMLRGASGARIATARNRTIALDRIDFMTARFR